jgi:3-methyladenine DNA glycosylase/8-oxoguanine DNA glycosylase
MPDPLSRDWLPPFPLDLRMVLGVHRRGPGDPAYQVAGGAVWRTSHTPDGPGTLRITARPAPPAEAGDAARGPVPEPGLAPHGGLAGRRIQVRAQAWGPGAAWLLDGLPDLLGAADDPSGFVPVHPLLRDLVIRHPGFRIGRTNRVMEALVPAVLEQKVVGLEAHRAWRVLLTRFGDPAPGPGPGNLRVAPLARTWSEIPSWEWHRAGVENIRARTIASAALVASRLEEVTSLDPAEADRRLQALPGIGVWTSAETRQRACGDPDAVSVGDYHLASIVGWALTGARTDDAGMLELLAPYAGHRFRAARLLELSGAHPPRRGPRNPVRDYRSF